MILTFQFKVTDMFIKKGEFYMALDYKLIGERLKNSRIKKGYTQE